MSCESVDPVRQSPRKVARKNWKINIERAGRSKKIVELSKEAE